MGNPDIVLNDINAYERYKKYNILYNKLEIAKFQDLDCGPFQIQPNNFPIISKPIINLCGMGVNAKKINSIRVFKKEYNLGNFWCQFLEGEHYSWDLIIRNGKIIYHVCFFGEKKKLGLFKYWKQVEIELLPIIEKLINFYLKDFTGNINLETIGGKIIEVHLRPGDIDLVDSDIIKLLIMNSTCCNDEIIQKQMDIINCKKIDYNMFVKLVPVWEKKTKDYNNNVKKKYKMIEKKIVPLLNNDDMIEDYYIDLPNHPDPEGYKRWFLLLTYDLKYGLKLSKKIENMIKIF